MMKYFLIIGMLAGVVIGLNAQTAADAGYFDLDKLQTTKALNLDQLNTEQFEFSPAFLQNDLIFVQSKTDKKRFRLDDDNSFILKHSAKDPDGQFGTPVSFSGISAEGFFDGPCSISPDGKWLFVTRNQQIASGPKKEREQKLGIFIYQQTEAGWEQKGGLPVNSPKFNVCHPAWDAKVNTLYFASDMPGGSGGLDLYSIAMSGDQSWGVPQNLGSGINSPANDCFPFINQKYFLFFASDKEGGKGGFDLYASVNKNGIWGRPVGLEGLNTTSDDLGLILDEAGETLYFASSRPGGKGKDDLYAVRLESNLILKSPEYFTVKVLNRETSQPVEGVKMLFKVFSAGDAEIIETKDEKLSLVQEIELGSIPANELYHSGKNGEVNIYLPAEQYILLAEKEGFGITRRLIDLSAAIKNYTIYLDSIVCKGFEIVIEDGETKEKIEKYNIEPVSTMQYIMAKDGSMKYCLAKGQEFLGDVIAEGYYPRDIRISYEDIASTDQIRIAMDKIAIVEQNQQLPVKAGETIVLRQIYYDYNSAEIKPEAIKTLDQLANHMLRYTGMVIELSAHTDSRGKESYNQGLSLERAKNAKLYLVSKGIESARIVATGYGESRLLNHCKDGVKCSESDHALNRRTEVTVISHEEGLEFRYNGR